MYNAIIMVTVILAVVMDMLAMKINMVVLVTNQIIR